MGSNHSHPHSHAEDKDYFFKVEGVHCESCVTKVTRALEESRLCDSHWIDRATHVLRVRKGHIGMSDANFIREIEGLLKKVGFKAKNLEDPTHSKKNEWVLQLVLSLIGLALSYFVIPHESVPFTRANLMALLPLLVLFYFSYKSFFRGAWASLKFLNFTVDTLVSIGVGAAFILSMALIFMQIPGHLYWVEAFSILFLVSLGHYVENYVLIRADKTLRSLMVLVPPKANRIVGMGSVKEVLVSELKVGDTILIRPGDRVSVDGKITEGKSDFDESLLTGESMPLSKGIGDQVFSGTLNLSGNVKYSVQKLGKDMLLSQIIDTVVRVRQTRADIQKLADRISNIFVPVVVSISILSFVLWYLIPDTMGAWSHVAAGLVGLGDHAAHVDQALFWKAFSAALAVLVISCPCALGIATPAALMAVSGIAAKKGILIRDGRAIENAEKITHVFFDKTGTLSSAQPKLVNQWKLDSFEEKYLMPVASQSKHPMSRMLTKSASPSHYTAHIKEFPGEGVAASIQGTHTQVEVLMGNAGLIQRMDVKGFSAAQDFVLSELEQGRSLVYWAQNGVLQAVFSFEDEMREGVEKVLAQFGTDLQVRILSGDNKKVLSNLAKKLGIPESHALGELSPLDKVQVLQSYQKDNSKVAFVGDGLNDAPVLQAADLGIAVSSASDLAKQSADIVLLNKDIDAIFDSFQLAKRGMKTIRQNLMWAFAYNVIAIPLAFLGLISPVLCALSMAFSDLVIILNSLRVFLMKKA